MICSWAILWSCFKLTFKLRMHRASSQIFTILYFKQSNLREALAMKTFLTTFLVKFYLIYFFKTQINFFNNSYNYLDIQILQDFYMLFNSNSSKQSFKLSKEANLDVSSKFLNQINLNMSKEIQQRLNDFLTTNTNSLTNMFDQLVKL